MRRSAVLLSIALALAGCAALKPAAPEAFRSEDGRCCMRQPGCPDGCSRGPCRGDQVCQCEPGRVNSNRDCYVKPRCRCADAAQSAGPLSAPSQQACRPEG
jgi:hypothetical protein